MRKPFVPMGGDTSVMKHPNRRRRILVDDTQYRLLAVNVIHVAVVLVLFAVILFGPLVWQLGSGNLTLAEREQASTQLLSLYTRVWLPLLIAFVFLAVHFVYVSHRIGGPLYQFRRLLRAVRDGDLTVRAKLRRKDYLQNEAQIINELIDTMGSKIRGVEAHSEEVRRGLEKLRNAIDRGSRKEIAKLMDRLGTQTEQLQASLGEFRTWRDDENVDGEMVQEVPSTSPSETSAVIVGS